MTNPYHKYICIEGNIGTGKTTLCQMLAREWDCRLVLEQFTDNPFLPLFYQNPERYALQVELFFMVERHKQLVEFGPKNDLFDEMTVADYFFTKTMLFAGKNLNEEEYRLFKRLYDVMSLTAPEPDLLIYLHRSVDKIFDQITTREREIEKSVKKEYLLRIQNAYFEYFRHEVKFPVVILDIEQMDFEKKREDFDLLYDFLTRPYQPGVHRVSLIQ